MKAKPAFSAIVSALVLGMFATVRAQDSTAEHNDRDAKPAMTAPGDENRTHDAFDRDQAGANRLGLMQKASHLVGMGVRDQVNHRLGTIRDLIVDLGSGRVVCALVEPSRHLVSDYLVAVPATAFLNVYPRQAILKSGWTDLNRAPRFMSDLPDPAMLINSINSSYAYFKEPSVLAAGTHWLSKYTQLTGRAVMNRSGEDLGQIVNLMVDLRAGRIMYAVGALDQAGQDLYAVPPMALTVHRENPDLLLDSERVKVAETARHDDFFWTEMTDPAWAARTYRAYGQILPVDTGHGGEMDPTRENVRTKISDSMASPAPVDMGGRSDSAITQSILTAMVRDFDDDFSSRSIRIETVNGHVKLRGAIGDQKLKEKLGELAAGVVGRDNVENLLELQK